MIERRASRRYNRPAHRRDSADTPGYVKSPRNLDKNDFLQEKRTMIFADKYPSHLDYKAELMKKAVPTPDSDSTRISPR